jgi:hypothetical protein
MTLRLSTMPQSSKNLLRRLSGESCAGFWAKGALARKRHHLGPSLRRNSLPVIEARVPSATGPADRPLSKEVLRRLRNGGQQFVRVEHVHVNGAAKPSSVM